MRTFSYGDAFYGYSNANMINNAIGTNFFDYTACSVDLDIFDCEGVIAWFVYMEGTTHGYENGWKWKNFISQDGNTIKEVNVSKDKYPLIKRRLELGYRPYRLAFKLDPFHTGNRYCCQFVGVFRLKGFVQGKFSEVVYEKVADACKLTDKGQIDFSSSKKADFEPNSGIYFTDISELGISDNNLNLLKRCGIRNAGDLLELGLEDASKDFYDDVHKNLVKHFTIIEEKNDIVIKDTLEEAETEETTNEDPPKPTYEDILEWIYSLKAQKGVYHKTFGEILIIFVSEEKINIKCLSGAHEGKFKTLVTKNVIDNDLIYTKG